MKKLLSLLVAVFAIFACSFIVKADEEVKGSISIKRNETNYNTTYKAYRILDLNYANGSYAYSANENWAEFFESEAAQKCFVKVIDQNTNKPAKIKKNGVDYFFYQAKDGITDNSSEMAECAKAALEYAKEKELDKDPTAYKTTSLAATSDVASQTATLSDLPLGYYLVDSTLGALCHLTTTDTDVTISEKNAEPTIEKEANVSSSKIGDPVQYTVTIDVVDGYENYVFTDTMDGLTFDESTLEIYYDDVKQSGISIGYPTSSESFTFKIDFTGKDLSNVDKIIIKYTGIINEDAVDGSATNGAELSFGDGNTTDKDQSSSEVKLYTTKFHKTKGNNVALDGAIFKLYGSKDGEDEIKVVKVSDGVYRVATKEEIDACTASADSATCKIEDIVGGSVEIKGLALGKYYIEEIEAPKGYTKLGDRLELNVVADTVNDIEVVNTTGAVLPSTGGIGTKLFMIFGSLMVVVFGTLLVTKFRVAKQN